MMTAIGFLTARPIAHRGLHDGNVEICENSLPAFNAAIARNFAIELDVQLSSDNEAIVFHDGTLDRLTEETGPVGERTADELKAMKLGKTGARIPTLRDTLEYVAGRVPIIVEMKNNGARNHALALAVAGDLVGYEGPVAVMSFAHSLLAAFHKTGSSAPLGLTAEGIGRISFEKHHEALHHGIGFVSYHVKALPNPFVAHVRGTLGLPVITWTVRTPEDVAATSDYADQMTFEGFDPEV
jgi:glycerophosphoryl diester phosphodiesterase